MSDDTPREDSFQVTLTSNHCLDYFPNNHANLYTNHLMRKLQCTPPGDWEFALIDIQFPVNWPNVLETSQLAIIVELHESAQPVEGRHVVMPRPTWRSKRTQFPNDPFIGAILEAKAFMNEENPGPYQGDYDFTEILELPKGHYNSIEDFGHLIEAQYQALFQAYNEAFSISSSIQFIYEGVTGVARFITHGPVDIYFACTNKYLLETLFRFNKTSSAVLEESSNTQETAASGEVTETPVKQKQIAAVGALAAGLAPVTSAVDAMDATLQAEIITPMNIATVTKPSSSRKYENLHFYKLPLTSRPEAELEHLSAMFVYSDIAQYHLIGGSVGQILGIIPIRSAEGENRFRGAQQFYTINPPYYMPVPKAEIEEITIQLNTDWGAPFPFAEAGGSKVRCRLHFRKRIPQGRRWLI